MNDADVRGYIRRKLGACVVGVELTDDQLDDAIGEAKLWFASYVGQSKYAVLYGNGTTTYSVAADVESVVDVIFPSDGSSIADMFGWAGVKLSMSDIVGRNAQVGEGYVFSGLFEQMQYLELAKMVMNATYEWEWDRERRLLVVNPILDSGLMFAYTYMVNSITLSLLTQAEQLLLRDYAYAQAMITLGNMRTKFADMPGSSGSFSMNGDTLFANADTLIMGLDEKIKRLGSPVSFIVG